MFSSQKDSLLLSFYRVLGGINKKKMPFSTCPNVKKNNFIKNKCYCYKNDFEKIVE